MSQFENRLTRCPGCNDTFTYRYPTTVAPDNLLIRTTCPFCKVPIKIDLSAYQRPNVVIYRGETDSSKTNSLILQLPDELPATLAD